MAYTPIIATAPHKLRQYRKDKNSCPAAYLENSDVEAYNKLTNNSTIICLAFSVIAHPQFYSFFQLSSFRPM